MVAVRELLDDPALGLTLICGQDRIDREVGWAHVSELRDPTEFLEGGELLLLTGVELPRRRDEVFAYVDRLVAAGTVAIGFGIGVRRPTVPTALRDACAAADLPLLSVSRATPFLAITKAVSRAIAAREDAEHRFVLRARERLTAAAVGTRGPEALVAELVRLVGGWAMLVNHSGALITAVPAREASRYAALRPDLDRLAAGSGAGSLVSHSPDAGNVWMQTLHTGQDNLGALVLGGKRLSTIVERQIAPAAVSLLVLVLDRSRLFESDRLALEAATLGLMSASGRPELRQTVERVALDLWQGMPAAPVTVIEGRGSRYAMVRARERLAADRTIGAAAVVFALVGAALVIVTPTELVTGIVSTRGETLGGMLAGLHAGISESIGLHQLTEAREQARRAADHAVHEDLRVLRWAHIPAPALLDLVPAEVAERYGTTMLAPLDDVLIASLRAWLAHHGQWDPAAADLGIHRHTLRNRLRKIEGLLGYRLDSATRRAELWLALQMREREPGD